ncbi:MAG: M20 family metallo-hydrolase [Desulfovibrio sp.]|nr:M20 family metallo-hydrolase [Desulfovibrio sp.]
MTPSDTDHTRILTFLKKSDEQVFSLQSILTSFQALPPEHGGDGEAEKAAWIEAYLKDMGISSLFSVNAKDTRVSKGYRPNLIAKIPGKSTKTLWIFSHLDVVSPGDRNAWKTDPWTVVREGDLLYGRGVEDNQQATVSSLLLCHALQTLQVVPELSLGLVFMADEENGSTYGLAHVLKERSDLFNTKDIFLVPDFGSPKADLIEVAEKASLWLKIETIGKQGHASTPEKGINAFVAGSALVVALANELPQCFPERNALFSPATSTFVPSKHEANAEGINILPGRNVFYLDCRLLPGIDEKMVLEAVGEKVDAISKAHNVHSTVSIVHAQKASAVDEGESAITQLQQAIASVYHVTAKPKGVGGGTVAALLREKGLPALVWSCLDNTCHTPNEHSSIAATINDSCVFAHLLFNTYA